MGSIVGGSFICGKILSRPANGLQRAALRGLHGTKIMMRTHEVEGDVQFSSDENDLAPWEGTFFDGRLCFTRLPRLPM